MTSNPSPSEDPFKKWWLHRYHRRPAVTIVVTLLIFAAFAATVFYANRHDQQIAEARRRQVLDYEVQLSELSKLETSLRNLTEFVRTQKMRLKESEDLIATLKSEEQRLTPFVEADRRVVKAVLDLQQEQSRAALAHERWIGFGLGIVASIVASILYGIVGPFIAKRVRSRA